MNFTFQVGNPAGAGMSNPPKQLIIRPQALLIMQLSAFLLLALGLQVSAATYSQTVSFTGKDVPLKTVLASVKKQTGYGVFFENGEAMLQSSAPVTIDLKNVQLEIFLRICLKDQPLEYALEGKTIFIKKKEPVVSLASPPPPPGDPILQIKGRVTNDKGEPLVNANITVKRNGHGTVTDANGNFYLRNVNSDDVVNVTFIGYKTVSMPIKDRISLTVVLSATTNDLDKVVVQAYGTTSQRLATGNIGTVTAEQIARQPVMNPLEALQGQVAGVVVTNASGYASAPIKVEIRGRNTINANFPSDPLYIIDGVPLTILNLTGSDSYTGGATGVIQSGIQSPAGGQSPFFNINPTDIESITVLKDADATAIYGSRGSNGVILINTKKGKAGKTHFDLSVYSGISQVNRHFQLLNSHQYTAMRKEALANDGLPLDINNAADLVTWDTTRYTDWQKYLWGGLGKYTDVESSLSGGDSRTTFRVAAGYHYQTEILTSSGANQRASLSFNINHKSLNQRFNMGFTGTYTLITSDMIFTPGAITLPPDAPAIFDNKGNLNFSGWAPLNGNYPFGSLLQPYTAKSNLLNSNLVLSYEMTKGLILKTSLGYNNIQSNQTSLTPITSQDPANNPVGQSSFGYTLLHNFILEPQLEYNNFISKGKLNILLGSSIQNNTTNSIQLMGFGYNNDALLTSVINAPVQSSANFSGEYKYEAVFGRINYNWDNKYIINLNTRRDGSSRFGPGRQFGNFGSVGAAWIFSEETLIKKKLSFLSLGKVRGSYGTTGGDEISDYAFLSQWSFNRFTYNGVLPLTPLGHTDSTLHWQVNRKLEVAVDLSFLKDRINLEAVWYRNRCSDQLVAFPTPLLTGFTSVTSNSPADVQNTGWEFLLNAEILNEKNFSWSAKFNIGINRNKLIKYPNLSQSPYGGRLIIGQSINIIKLLHFTGIDPQTGLYTFQDKNKDGQITVDQTGQTTDDRYIHDLSPKFDGGFTNNFNYKNWQLSVFIYYKKQIGRNALISLDAPGDITNQPTSVLNHWKKEGDIANNPRFTTSPGTSFYNYQIFSDAIYTDASFIRLQNLSLSYTLPQKIIKTHALENCKIYIQGENLFIITKYNGLDPEVQGFTSIPRARTITAGISCNF